MSWQALTAGKVGEGWFAPSFAQHEICADAGFHNTYTENVRVREDNFTYTKHGRLYLEYKQGDETVDHESDFEAFCGSCNKLLPWPTFALRCLNGLPLKEATIKVAQLVVLKPWESKRSVKLRLHSPACSENCERELAEKRTTKNES